MAITVTLYDTHTLLGVIRVLQPVQDYWLSLCFPRQINFEDEYIDFEKVSSVRRIAPFVAPLAQGVPIYSEGSTVTRVKAAYIKPKDAVSPTRVLKKRPGSLADPAASSSPSSRYNALIGDIMREHNDAIRRRWEWMAAQAIIYGAVTIVDDNYPERVVSFGRAGGHTITLGSGARWGDSGISIIGLIESWRTTMRRALFGGMTNRITIGSDVWTAMRNDVEIRNLLAINLRPYNNNIDLNLGIREGLEVEQVGRLSNTLDVWIYSDYYQASDGSQVPFMSSKDIVLTGPGIQGVQCFGAILDPNANFNAVPIFPRMFMSDDPPVTYCMTQSAPLMVPVNPNVSFRATVVA